MFIRVGFEHRSAFLGANVTNQVRLLLQELFNVLCLLLTAAVNLIAMIFVIRQRGVDLRQRQTRIDAGRDLLGRVSAQVASGYHIANANPVFRDSRFSANNARGTHNMGVLGLDRYSLSVHRPFPAIVNQTSYYFIPCASFQ